MTDYLPEVYRGFRQQYPEVAEAYDALAVKCHASGPLDDRTRRLVKLGIAVGINSEGAVRSHARRALDEGVSPEELRHAVLLGLTTIGFPEMNAALKWVDTVIEKHP
jgi:alkylhydroperoxidase/carboxymuconolactone decarboxylase family protein YurZ